MRRNRSLDRSRVHSDERGLRMSTRFSCQVGRHKVPFAEHRNWKSPWPDDKPRRTTTAAVRRCWDDSVQAVYDAGKVPKMRNKIVSSQMITLGALIDMAESNFPIG